MSPEDPWDALLKRWRLPEEPTARVFSSDSTPPQARIFPEQPRPVAPVRTSQQLPPPEQLFSRVPPLLEQAPPQPPQPRLQEPRQLAREQYRGDEAVIYFPVSLWETVSGKRGQSPEEKGYFFAEESEDGNTILAAFHFVEARGSNVEVSSVDEALDAIEEFTVRHQELQLIPYHTHPIEGPSSGDKQSYAKMFSKTGGRVRNFLTIGPQTVQVNRVYRTGEGKYRIPNLVGSDYFKVVNLATDRMEGFTARSSSLEREFREILQRKYRR